MTPGGELVWENSEVDLDQALSALLSQLRPESSRCFLEVFACKWLVLPDKLSELTLCQGHLCTRHPQRTWGDCPLSLQGHWDQRWNYVFG